MDKKETTCQIESYFCAQRAFLKKQPNFFKGCCSPDEKVKSLNYSTTKIMEDSNE